MIDRSIGDFMFYPSQFYIYVVFSDFVVQLVCELNQFYFDANMYVLGMSMFGG